MFRYLCFSAGAQAVQSFQFLDAMRSFLHVYGSKSAIRRILRSVSKPTVIFSMFEVGKAYRIDLKLWSNEMSKQLKLACYF